MTPPNITKGEWKLREETIDGWGGDEVSFSIRDENNELIVCLDMDQRYARFLSASKAMAEALLVFTKGSVDVSGSALILGYPKAQEGVDKAVAALLQAGYTD